jgi:hypothetical protein
MAGRTRSCTSASSAKRQRLNDDEKTPKQPIFNVIDQQSPPPSTNLLSTSSSSTTPSISNDDNKTKTVVNETKNPTAEDRDRLKARFKAIQESYEDNERRLKRLNKGMDAFMPRLKALGRISKSVSKS